jgi:hypothetical protein
MCALIECRGKGDNRELRGWKETEMKKRAVGKLTTVLTSRFLHKMYRFATMVY